jgi:hypothetical protein
MKPNDLLLGVIEFFGILIPGAVLAFLHGNFILKPLKLSIRELNSFPDWIPAFFFSYVLGHFLFAISEFVFFFADRLLRKRTKEFYEAIKDSVQLPKNVSTDYSSVFNSAFSYIRIKSPEAISEVERRTGEYKLFRSMTLLFLLDILFSTLSNNYSCGRLGFSLLIAGLAFWRFCYLFDWTHYLVFDFFLQLKETKEEKSI